jgi:hypothetical protein
LPDDLVGFMNHQTDPSMTAKKDRGLTRRKFLSKAALVFSGVALALGTANKFTTTLAPWAGQTILNPVRKETRTRYKDVGILVNQDNVTIVNPDIEGYLYGVKVTRKPNGDLPKNTRILFDPTAQGASTARGFVDNYMGVYGERFYGLEIGGLTGSFLKFRDNYRPIELSGGIDLNVHHNDILGPGYVHPLSYNGVRGSVSGIKFLPDASLGKPLETMGIQITDNKLAQISEESISTDCRGNEGDKTPIREIDYVSSVDPQRDKVTLASGNWDSSTSTYDNYWMVFIGGTSSGKRVQILFRSGRVFTVSDPNDYLLGVGAGSIAMICIPFISPYVARNQIDARWGRVAIDAHGLTYEGLYEDNQIIPPNSFRYTTRERTGMRTETSGATVFQALRISSLTGLISSYSSTGHSRRASCEGNVVRNNRVYGGPGDITFHLIRYSEEPYGPLRNRSYGNIFEAGGTVYADQYQDLFWRRNLRARQSGAA